VLVIEAIHQLFPWLRHLFADSVYNGLHLREALAKFGKWTIEIVKRTADAARLSAAAAPLVPRTNPGLAQSKSPLGTRFRGIDRERQGVGIHRLGAAPHQEISMALAQCFYYTIQTLPILIQTLSGHDPAHYPTTHHEGS
jgi:hypothetical protein